MIFIMKPYFVLTTFILLLTTPQFSFSIRPDTDGSKQITHEGNDADEPSDEYFGPGSGFVDIPDFSKGWPGSGIGSGHVDIPEFGKGWPGSGIVGGGYGGGYSSPSGGYSRNGVIRPTVVCKEKGPCFKKKVTCPAECFTSYSRSGKNFGGGGGGGSCTIDCKKNCIAYC